MTSLELDPALRLLAHWAPDRTLTLRDGRLPSPDEQSWSETPDLASVVPQRIPLAVEVLDHETGSDAEWSGDRPREEVAVDVEALLLAAYPGDRAEAVRELLGQIAFEFAGHPDLARLTVAAEAGGTALDELHLLARGFDGRTLGLSVTAGAEPPAGPADHLADVALVLGEYVWLSNNERLDIAVKTEAHGLAAVTVDAFGAWWPTSETAAALLVDLWDEEPESEVKDAGSLAAFRDLFTAFNLDNARSGAWAAGLVGDYDVDDDPQPRFPGDRLVEILTRELLDGAAGLAGDPVLVYGLDLPEEDHEGFVSALLFAGPERVVVLAFNAAM